jgi:hypothetical protein
LDVPRVEYLAKESSTIEIVIAEQGAFRFDPSFSAEEARGRAGAHKGAAFGTLSRLLARPKDEDIAIEERGLLYIPMWHAKAHLRFVYDRRESYRVAVKTPNAKTVTIAASDFAVSAQANFDLPAVEHCERDERKELWLDAVTNQPVNAAPYLKAQSTPIALDDFAPEGARIVAPTVRASAVIRNLLGNDFRPSDADEIKEEDVNVECIDLHLRPAYAFKYVWSAKNKTAEVAIDGITGEINSESSATTAALAKLLRPETLFDLGAETLNVIVPGGAIALKLGRALAEKRKA